MLDLVQSHTQLQNIHKITFNLYMDLKMLHVNDNFVDCMGSKICTVPVLLFY